MRKDIKLQFYAFNLFIANANVVPDNTPLRLQRM